MEHASRPGSRSLLVAMAEDLAALDRGMERVLHFVVRHDAEVARRAFDQLMEQLLAHLRMEGEGVLRAFAQVAPGQADSIWAKHASLHRELSWVRARVHAGVLEERHVTRFMGALRAPTGLETALLYLWADAMLTRRDKEPLLRWADARAEERRLCGWLHAVSTRERAAHDRGGAT